MNKEARLVIRMTADFRAWIDTMADAVELDASSWVRLQLAQVRRGNSPAFPIMSSYIGPVSPDSINGAFDENNAPVATAGDSEHNDWVDPNDLIAAALATAESQGLTNPLNSDEIPLRTRALKRPPVRFSTSTQAPWIEGQ